MVISQKTQNLLNENLHKSIMERNYEQVVKLLDQGADVNSVDDEGHSALHRAVRSVGETEPNFQIINLLLSRPGIDVDLADRSGWTPLHSAYHAGYGRIVGLLINAGANTNLRNHDGHRYNEVNQTQAAQRGPGQ